nr:DUF4124 domain-containing protein [Shewanella sp. Isolate11]
MTRKSFCALLLVLFFCPTLFATTIYKWVDEKGVTHYSQQMPPEKQAEKLYSEDIEQQRVGFVAPSASAAKEPVPSEMEAAANEINQKDKEQAKMICDSATHQLNVLNTHTNLTRKNAQTGEMEKMTEEQRQEQIAAQQERIRLFCTQ